MSRYQAFRSVTQNQGRLETLIQAMIADIDKEVQQILAQAEAQADEIRRRGEVAIKEEQREIILRAHEEVQALRQHTLAAARLEAQQMKLEHREKLLAKVFEAARRRFGEVVQWEDYPQIVRHLVAEAVALLADTPGQEKSHHTLIVRMDERTRQAVPGDAIHRWSEELGVPLQVGVSLTSSTGVIVETPDGHRRYDNTLEARLERMQDLLRASVYHILMGEEP